MRSKLNPAERIPCLLAILVCLAGTDASRADLVLAEKGRSNYRIVIPTQAIPSERYAAEELQAYLEKISGVRLPIRTDAERPNAREILIGDTSRNPPSRPALTGTDGFIMKTEGNRLVIRGTKPRGTLNGVYTLLEDKLGVRWFTPEMEFVPATNRVVLGKLDERFVPVLEYREVFWTEMMRDGDFAARHRLNGNHYKLTERHGGRFAVYHPFVHSFDSLIPPDLFKEHPDYFPLINGKRTSGYVQRCLANPDVVKSAIARVRQWIKDNPQATIISVSQNDTGNWCLCEDCKALDDAEGTPCASLLRFVNAVARDIETDYPNVRIDTLAYQYTRKPPKTLRPRPNVIVRLCSIECCFAHPLADCGSAENRRFREDILAWQPVAPLLYVWDYTPNFAHYQQPFPNFAALQPNVRFFVQHGVKGLFEQGNYSPGGYGELGALRAYVLAKLIWNPEADVQKHISEFTAAYYGAAAPRIRDYLKLLGEQVREPGIHAHIFDPPGAAYLSEAFLAAADTLLAEGEQKAENESVRERVRTARLPVWYAQIATGRVTGDRRDQMLKDFLEVARKVGISHINESRSLQDWADKGGR